MKVELRQVVMIGENEIVERNYESGRLDKNGIIGEKYRNGRISRTDKRKYRKRREWKNRINDKNRGNGGGEKSSRKGKIEVADVIV